MLLKTKDDFETFHNPYSATPSFRHAVEKKAASAMRTALAAVETNELLPSQKLFSSRREDAFGIAAAGRAVVLSLLTCGF
jgi:hypothetical protein